MTPDEFAEVTTHRIPTAPEFVAFATGQRWKFVVNGLTAGLVVPNRNDPLVLAFAKMLSREPYRTNVLLHLEQMRAAPEVDAAVRSEEACALCLRTVAPATAAVLCQEANRPARLTLLTEGGAYLHTENPPCHYQRKAA